MRGLVIVLLLACGGSEASFDAGGGRDGARPTAPTFAWDPWPTGPVSYRRDLRCNFNAARPGECPPGFRCGESVEITYAALTRDEGVCEWERGAPMIQVGSFAVYEPRTPLVVTLFLTLDGEPLENADGTLRVLDLDGAEAFAGRLPENGRVELAVDPGSYTLTLSLAENPVHPPWVRGGELTVRGEGAVAIPLESALVHAEGAGTLELRNQVTGTRRELVLPADVRVVPGTSSFLLHTPAGSQPFDDAELEGEVTMAFDALPIPASGEIRVDGEPLANGSVLFRDPITETILEATVADGRWARDLLDRPWDVYVDTRTLMSDLPRMRARVGEAVDVSGPVVLDASVVTLRGELRVDGAPAPLLGERFGFFQPRDALGVTGPGVDVTDGTFEERLFATRLDLFFIGTHPTAPRLGQTAAENVMLTDAPVDAEITTAWLEVRLTHEGRTLPEAPPERPEGRGVVVVAGTQGRSTRLRLPPRGEAIARAPVPHGRWQLLYENERLEGLPTGAVSLGAVEVTEDTRVDHDLATVDVGLAIPPLAGGQVRFSDQGGVSHVETRLDDEGRATVRLHAGTYRIRELCTDGCGRLVTGWLRLSP